jgi:general secretion pathway protein D
MRKTPLHIALTIALAGNLVLAQTPQPVPKYVSPAPQVLPQGGYPVMQQVQPKPTAAQPQAQPAQPAPPPAATPAAAAPAPAPQTTQPAEAPPPNVTAPGALNLDGASLLQAIDILAGDLHINYILDPRVKGTVTIHTYGEIKAVDVRPLLETILRMNGFYMVQVGDVYRIVPVGDAARLPVPPEANASKLPDDERLVLDLIFLKYVTSADMSKLLEQFIGEGAKMIPYDPANLLIIEDNSRNMRRTMDLINMFDSDALAGQRVHSYEVKEGRPSDLVKELDTIFRAYALSDKSGVVKFLPVDRINTIIAVAPNPGSFKTVEEWIKKLDIPAKPPVGSVDNQVYRFKYGRAEIIGPAISQLYGGPGSMGGSSYGQTQFGNLSTTGLSGGGMLGGGSGGAYGSGVAGGSGMGIGQSGAFPGGGGGSTTSATGMPGGFPSTTGTNGATGYPGTGMGNNGMSPNQTGSYLGNGGMGGFNMLPRIIPNPYDNTLLIQSTPEQWAQILKLLEQLDISPRQVLIDCKIYEVDLSGALSYGVQYYLQQKNSAAAGFGSQLLGAAGSATAGVSLTAGILATQSRQLLAAVTASDVSQYAKLVASPSVIATDSIPAAINVGEEVPVLSSQAVAGIQQAGSSLFTNTISEQNTGVTLGIVARINASGIVTMVINQEYSQPITPPAGAAIQSDSFQQRTVSTQVTVNDGDTIAIGGIIQENTGVSSTGIPFLSRLPYIGGLFGYKSYTKSRTEMLVFLTPRVIYDTNQMQDASQDLKERMKDLRRTIKDE